MLYMRYQYFGTRVTLTKNGWLECRNIEVFEVNKNLSVCLPLIIQRDEGIIPSFISSYILVNEEGCVKYIQRYQFESAEKAVIIPWILQGKNVLCDLEQRYMFCKFSPTSDYIRKNHVETYLNYTSDTKHKYWVFAETEGASVI